VTGVRRESYWRRRIIEESWGKDEGPNRVVCGGREEAGSIWRPRGWLVRRVDQELIESYHWALLK
jgi:hypothetical protein